LTVSCAELSEILLVTPSYYGGPSLLRNSEPSPAVEPLELGEDTSIPNRLLWIFLAVFFGRLLWLSSQKDFWHDELFSLSVVSAGSFTGVWEAMTAGYEFNPPATYLGIGLVELLFTRGELTSRLPFLLAGLISCWAMFRFSSRVGKPWRGLWTVLFLVQSGAVEYFYDARAYAFVLAGAACGLLGWRERTQLGLQGAAPLALMALGWCLVTASHVWAIFVIGCFGLGELWRWVAQRRVDWAILAAFCVAGLPVLMYPILIETFGDQVYNEGTYRHTLYGAYLQIVGVILVGYFLAAFPVYLHQRLWGQRVVLRWEPVVQSQGLLFGLLLLLPVLIFLASLVSGSSFMGRYALAASLAVAVVAATLVDILTAGDDRYRLYVFCALVSVAVFNTFGLEGRPGVQEEVDWRSLPLDELDKDSLIVIGSGMKFISIQYYASAELKPRIRKVVDPELSLKYLDTNGEDTPLMMGATYLGIQDNLMSYEDLLALEDSFWFVDYQGWLQSTGAFRGAVVEPYPGTEILYRVTLSQ
jgi:hypothetical protein